MANTTQNRTDSYKPSGGPFHRGKVHADQVLVYGGLVSFDADGFLVNASDTANHHFAGVAVEAVDSTGLADGDLRCLVDMGGALVKVVHEDGSMSDANIGDAVMAEHNNEVTSAGTGTNDIPVGKILDVVSATVIWVQCKPFGVVS